LQRWWFKARRFAVLRMMSAPIVEKAMASNCSNGKAAKSQRRIRKPGEEAVLHMVAGMATIPG